MAKAESLTSASVRYLTISHLYDTILYNMSEASNGEIDQQFRDIVSNMEQAPEQTREEKLGELAEKFRQGQVPYSLDELDELSHGVGEEWQEDDFGGVTPFVDEAGRLVMIARPREEMGTSLSQREKTWRLLFDDNTVTINIPSEFAGRGLRFRSSKGFDVIYDTTKAEEGVELPEDMQRLVDKFGPRLSKSYAERNHYLDAKKGAFWELSKLASEIKRPEREAYVADWDEAHNIERTAQDAKNAVQRGLFMTARRHARLQEQAYRDSIRRSSSLH